MYKSSARAVTSSDIDYAPDAILARLGPVARQELSRILSIAEVFDPRLILLELSLHLPRFEAEVLQNEELVVEESRRIADRLSILQAPHLDRAKAVACATSSLKLVEVPHDDACAILNSFHYLLSAREDGVHLGLMGDAAVDGFPMAMLTISPFDLWNVGSAVGALCAEEMVVISRVFVFQRQPRNLVSLLLAAARRWLRANRPDVLGLMTYVNPNMGFTGSSYRADNWALLGHETGVHYRYLDGVYRTERYLRAQMSTGVRSRIAVSKHPLRPLRLYIRFVRRNRVSDQELTFGPWSTDLSHCRE